MLQWNFGKEITTKSTVKTQGFWDLARVSGRAIGFSPYIKIQLDDEAKRTQTKEIE